MAKKKKRKPDSAYWKKRFTSLEASQNAYAAKTTADIVPGLEKAQRQVQASIEKWVSRFAKNNKLSMTEARKQLSTNELAEFKWNVLEYIEKGNENTIDGRWMKELENASARFHVSRLQAMQIDIQQAIEVAYGNELDEIDAMMKHLYSEGYYRSIFEIQKGFNVGFNVDSINQEKLERILSNPWVADGRTFSNRIWTSKTQMLTELQQQLVRQCAMGKAPDDAIKTMSKFVDKKFKNAKVQAGRLVMTEEAFISSAAQKDAFKELGVEEFEVVATLDTHTSDICQDMDGQHFPMSQYEIGSTAPPFHVWCRSTTVPYFDDEWSIGERAARNNDGKTTYVPSDLSYSEWYDRYINDGDLSNLTDVSYDDTIQMGALSGALNPNSKQASKHAVQYYESVRKMSTDCESISNNTGYALSFVQDVKNHLFMTKHDLGNGTLEYFFPDYEIAQSWQRLMDSKMNVQPHDLILLEHEHAEYLYMKQGMTQEQAHHEAEKKYNYAKALKERK